MDHASRGIQARQWPAGAAAHRYDDLSIWKAVEHPVSQVHAEGGLAGATPAIDDRAERFDLKQLGSAPQLVIPSGEALHKGWELVPEARARILLAWD
jgi:hypothetical protein